MPIPGLTRRRQTFYLTVVKPADLRSGPNDRYAFRGTMGTRDEAVARIKALAIRADLETQWQAERDRRRPQPAIVPTSAIVDMLILKLRAEMLEADDLIGERFLFPKFIQTGNKRPSELAGRYFLDLRREAGIDPDPRFSAHSCRHNVRSALAAARINESVIDKLIGHESGAVQSRYTHAVMSTLVDAVGRLDWSGLGFTVPLPPSSPPEAPPQAPRQPDPPAEQREEAQAAVAAQARQGHLAKVERSNAIRAVGDRLNALFGMDGEPQKRGKLLEGVLNDLFRAYGILLKEDFKRQDQAGTAVVEQIDGVIELDGHTHLVEMKWLKDPVGVNELSSHMVRVYARPDVRGIFISASEFASTAVNECITHSAAKTMVLCSLRELVMLLNDERDLVEFLRAKVRAAVLEKRPFVEILS